MGKKRPEPFSQIVAAAPVADYPHQPSEILTNFAQQAQVTTADGIEWSRRGSGRIKDKRLRRLILDDTVRVLHDYLGEVQEIAAGDGREYFWALAQAKQRASGFADFYGGEFLSPQRDRLVVVHEDC